MTDDDICTDLPDLTGVTLRELLELDVDKDPRLRAALARIERVALRGPRVEYYIWPATPPGP